MSPQQENHNALLSSLGVDPHRHPTDWKHVRRTGPRPWAVWDYDLRKIVAYRDTRQAARDCVRFLLRQGRSVCVYDYENG